MVGHNINVTNGTANGTDSGLVDMTVTLTTTESVTITATVVVTVDLTPSPSPTQTSSATASTSCSSDTDNTLIYVAVAIVIVGLLLITITANIVGVILCRRYWQEKRSIVDPIIYKTENNTEPLLEPLLVDTKNAGEGLE